MQHLTARRNPELSNGYVDRSGLGYVLYLFREHVAGRVRQAQLHGEEENEDQEAEEQENEDQNETDQEEGHEEQQERGERHQMVMFDRSRLGSAFYFVYVEQQERGEKARTKCLAGALSPGPMRVSRSPPAHKTRFAYSLAQFR